VAEDAYPSRVGGVAERLPRRDPVVHGGPGRSGPLSAEQLRRYEEQGFLTFDAFFSPTEVAALQGELRRLDADRARLDPETLVLEPDGDALRSVFRVHEQSGLVAALACDARLRDVARFLLDDEVYVHQSRLNWKPGFHGREFYWHSDFETWHVEDGMPRMRAFSVSIALTENNEWNGPLMLIPGSHHHYVTCVGETPAEHYKQSLRRQEIGVPDPASLTWLAERGGIMAPKGPPGSVTLFDCNMMHGSGSNLSPWPRSNAFLVFNAVSNRLQAPFGGTAPRPEFIATRERVEPLRARRGRTA